MYIHCTSTQHSQINPIKSPSDEPIGSHCRAYPTIQSMKQQGEVLVHRRLPLSPLPPAATFHQVSLITCILLHPFILLRQESHLEKVELLKVPLAPNTISAKMQT